MNALWAMVAFAATCRVPEVSLIVPPGKLPASTTVSPLWAASRSDPDPWSRLARPSPPVPETGKHSVRSLRSSLISGPIGIELRPPFLPFLAAFFDLCFSSNTLQ
jgi:hypothetical protein